MSASTHVHIDELTSYLDDPHSADAKKISRHLAQCAICRSQLNTLSSMRGHLKAITGDAYAQSMQTDGQLAQMLQTQSIERFVDGGLVEEEQRRVQETLTDNPLALKAALHYTSHSAAMDRALNPPGESSQPSDATRHSAHGKPPGKTSLAAIKVWLTQRIPLWTTLPVAALATGILVVALTFSYSSNGGRVQIASYQDNPVVQFRSPSQAPGIGFFGTAAKSSAPFEPVEVVVSAKDSIVITWPSVPQASTYVVRLARREKGGTKPLAEKTTSVNSAAFKGLEIIFDHRYVWTLSGKTTDKKDFYAEGGFVFHQPDS